MRDADVKFHKEWLGLAQPSEGLVFSVPALADAQIAPRIRSGITAELEAHLEETDAGLALRGVRDFFETFLGYSRPAMLVDRGDLPPELTFYAPEGRQEIRPSFAIARGPFEANSDDPFAEFESGGTNEAAQTSKEESRYLALVWDLSTDAGSSAVHLDLDKSEAETGPWRYPPTAKLERLLRHTGIPIGFVSNRRELRLVYAPPGESTGHLTFRFKDLAERAGRPLVAALELLFHAHRTYESAPEFTFEGLLRDSRVRQADVTKDLAAQVFEAVEILVEGFEHAAARDCVGDHPDWLRAALEEPDDHFYQGVLSVVLRLVFILYSEDQGLLPVEHPTYAEHMSVLGLYERLADDAGAHPESMHRRFGAYGRLISLFRAVFLGVQHEDLHLPPRRGKLFDPSAFPFLEGGLPGWTAAITLPEERAAVRLPSIDDETVYRVLHRLVVFKGQRLSYRSLDVEQIGAVYESLMGYHVLRVQSPAVRIGKLGVWAEADEVRRMKPSDRKRFWKDVCGLSTTGVKKAESAVKPSEDADSLAEALFELAPGGKAEKPRHWADVGRLVLQPSEERRRTGTHYTPRWLSEKVVRRTLDPILASLGEHRTAEQILSLKICDPAMGSGAFLVATCRLLAEEVVEAWKREGESAAFVEEYGDAILHARRLVAQRCLYGVDKNPAAVELAKLSLWLVTLSKELPFTFVDHALRHGDSLMGLSLEQLRCFHWEPKIQLETCRRALEDSLEQALEHRDRIVELAEREDPVSQQEKQRLLDYAEQATTAIRLVADVCVGAFFSNEKGKQRERERNKRVAIIESALAGDESAWERLQEMAAEVRVRHEPFHWALEFPEVFCLERPDPLENDATNRAAFMDAFIGNPPFLTGTRISTTYGNAYREWIFGQRPSVHGNADLSVHFLLRARSLLGAHGTIGLLATATIAQGDSRTSGLVPLLSEGSVIYEATTARDWPGVASVQYCMVCLATARLAPSVRRLDDRIVANINSELRAGAERPEVVGLVANRGLASKGVDTGGEGFIINPGEAEQLQKENPSACRFLRPYIGGQELNNSPHYRHSRFVIDFTGCSLKEAEKCPALLDIVRERVLPARQRLRSTPINDRLKESWWLFWAPRANFFSTLRELPRFLAATVYTKHLAFSFQHPGRVYNSKVLLIRISSFTGFAVLQSRIHELWARRNSSTLGDTLNYTVSDALSTFPFPEWEPNATIPSVEEIGQALYETRESYMQATEQGLTKTYNELTDPSCEDPRVLKLRRLHEQVDQAVLDAYGWGDLDVPKYCGSADGDQAQLLQFENELVDRLYALNAERAREEERLGLRSKRGARKRGAGKKRQRQKTVSDRQGDMF